MIRVSVAIMAHPRRAAFVPELKATLDRPAEVVWDDGTNSRWGTGRRALLAYDPAASHHLVVQDDAVIPRDLVAGVEQMLAHAPQDVPVCLYVGKVRPYKEMVAEYVKRAAGGASWLVMDRLNWGVAVILPTSMVEAVVAAGDAQTIPNYDSRMSMFFEAKGIDVWYPWPSLVDHRESPSLVPGRGHAGRVAHQFIGADTSALDTDYSGAALRLPDANSYRPGGIDMLFICEKYDNFSIPTANIHFDGHFFMARTAGQIAHLQFAHIKRRGVRQATEEELAAWNEAHGVVRVAEPAPVEPPAGAEEVKEPAPAEVSTESTPVEEDHEETPAEADSSEGETAGEVPNGTADDILAWVGYDAERAIAAEAVELAGKRRKVLLAELAKIIG